MDETGIDWTGYLLDAALILLPPLAFVLLMIGGFWPVEHVNLFGTFAGSAVAYLMSLVVWFLMLLTAKWDFKNN